LMPLLRDTDLPTLPGVCFALYTGPQPQPAAQHLAALVSDTITTLV